MDDRFKELEDRVAKFSMLELPGQPRAMHMGTSYLVSDLISAARDLHRERDEARAALSKGESP